MLPTSFGDIIIDGKSYLILGGPEMAKAAQPGWGWKLLASIGLPEVLLLLGAGLVVYYILAAIGKDSLGKMAAAIAIFNSIAVIVTHLKGIFGGM